MKPQRGRTPAEQTEPEERRAWSALHRRPQFVESNGWTTTGRRFLQMTQSLLEVAYHRFVEELRSPTLGLWLAGAGRASPVEGEERAQRRRARPHGPRGAVIVIMIIILITIIINDHYCVLLLLLLLLRIITCYYYSPDFLDCPLRYWGQTIAHQKSIPRKSSWIFAEIVQWTFSGVFKWNLTFVISNFWCVIFCPELQDRPGAPARLPVPPAFSLQ